MAITLTVNYKDTLAPETVQYIETELLPNNFDLGSILEFIDENGEDSFNECYPQYVELGEEYGFGAVDAFIKENSVEDLKYFSDAFIGEYLNARDMAEEFFEHETDRLDYRIVIDWDETAQYLLDHEVDRFGDFYFRHNW
jgi:spore coat protein CotH